MIEVPAHTDSVDDFEPIVPTDYSGFKMCFFDIETTNLGALMGRALAICSVDEVGRLTVFRADRTKRSTIIDDTELVIQARNFIEEQDIIVSWNGKLFDVPFLNARLLEAGELPFRSDLKHIDLMYYARGQFARIGSSKLDNVQRFLDTKTAKTPISWKEWQLAATGDPKAMDIVVEHCIADVYALREVFAQLKPLVRIVHR